MSDMFVCMHQEHLKNHKFLINKADSDIRIMIDRRIKHSYLIVPLKRSFSGVDPTYKMWTLANRGLILITCRETIIDVMHRNMSNITPWMTKTDQKGLDMIDMTADVLYWALTLQVTMAPTSGKSCASVSLTTEITGSCTEPGGHFISLLGYREAWVFKSWNWIQSKGLIHELTSSPSFFLSTYPASEAKM